LRPNVFPLTPISFFLILIRRHPGDLPITREAAAAAAPKTHKFEDALRNAEWYPITDSESRLKMPSAHAELSSRKTQAETFHFSSLILLPTTLFVCPQLFRCTPRNPQTRDPWLQAPFDAWFGALHGL